MDPDVVEIPPPIYHPSRLLTQKQPILHEVIDIDDDDDSEEELMIIGENVGKSSKGKTIEAVHHGYGDHQIMELPVYNFCQPGIEKNGRASGTEASDGYPSHNLISVNGHDSDLSYDDDDYLSADECASLQAHFDHVDIPPGVEAPVSCLPKHDIGLKKTGKSLVYTWCQTQSGAQSSRMSDSSQPSRSLEPTNPEIKGSLVGSSILKIKKDDIDVPPETGLSSPKLISHAVSDKKKLLGESSMSWWLLGSLKSKKKPANVYASTIHGSVDNSEAMKLPSAGEAHNGSFNTPGIKSQNPWWKISHNFMSLFTNYTYDTIDPLHTPPGHVLDNTSVRNSAREVHNGTHVDSPVATISDEVRDEILRKFQSFKQFDIIQNTSDHHFVGKSSTMKQHPKSWAKKILQEWKILEKDLPDSIYVRVYESRIDLLRAVIIGAEGTPYHDGLFCFDIFFPSGYPNVPPEVHYRSGGLQLNPNLYSGGRVCLSLLNTWFGNKNQKWLPGVSTILQVLVSVQGLILNAKPYFNEPGYGWMKGSAYGEKRSLRYNEDTFILSLRTMMYMIRKPPKNFEDFVVGHFCTRAHYILVACKAYMEGAKVGCLVKGGVQDVDAGDKSCSKHFKESLTGYVNMLVKEFAKTGAKD